MLALGIRYLTGYATATDPTDRARVEWPPHPARVFMALAASWFESGRDPCEKEALLWLEKQGAPALAAPHHDDRSSATFFVPVNDRSGPAKAMLQSAPGMPRLKQPRSFPKAWLADEFCHFIWSAAEPNEPTFKALDSLARRVTRVGHSSSLVQIWVAREAAVRPNWLPTNDQPTRRMRFAGEGFLEYLSRQFGDEQVTEFGRLLVEMELNPELAKRRNAKQELRKRYPKGPPLPRRPRVSLWQGYSAPHEAVDRIVHSGFSPNLIVLRLRPIESPFCDLSLRATLQVTARFREALMSIADELGTSPIPTLISGHAEKDRALEQPHLAPLAFCGHPHATGGIKALAIAVPYEASEYDMNLLAECLFELREPQRGLKLGALGLWKLERSLGAAPLETLRPETWTSEPRGALLWGTVTPIALDQHPKAKERGAYLRELAESIRASCERIGLPQPREVSVTPISAHLGVPPVRAFPRLPRKDGSERRHTHALLTFDQPVIGPVTLGAGRYRGYGVCRPVEL
jgi:CRISPR-associated protein Csb2